MKSKFLSNEARIYKNFIISISLIIILCLSGIFLGLAIRTKQLLNEENLSKARALYNNIVLTRKWNAHYGGVYIEKKEGIESNPYLENPDIRTLNGKIYTKKNPALMTREISEFAEKEGFFKFHITSLKLLNPNNKPDKFEQEALLSFEKGKKEVFKTTPLQNRTYFRYMAPLYVEHACLQCHAKQGYKIGEIRGGISVMFDIQDSINKLENSYLYIILFSITTIFSLLLFVYFFTGRLIRKISKARQVIDKMAITDGLTDLFNRMHLFSRFEEEFNRAKRLKNNLGCIMLDIDHFKSINDKYGHLTGDEVLKEISLRLRNSIRIYDVLGRYGGEEFLIVLPDTDFENAINLAERIRDKIKEKLIANIRVTISLGITSIQEKDETINDMIKRTDEALYKAKNSGRDRVEWL